MSGLEPFRRRLDEIDDAIVSLLGERFQICREVAVHKSEHGIPMMQPGRVTEVRDRYLARGAEAELPSAFTAELFDLLIAATCRAEDELMDRLAANGAAPAAPSRPAAPNPAAGRPAPSPAPSPSPRPRPRRATEPPMSRALPPGPRLPRPLQALAWMRAPLPFLERCHERYGDAFTLRIARWGDWVVLSDPADVKRVFTAGPRVGVALANPLLGPVLGPRSLMLLPEPAHLARRKLMLPPFHGAAVAADAGAVAEIARRAVASWPRGEPFELWPRMQAITQEVAMRAVFGPDEEGRLDELRRRLAALTRWLNAPRNLTGLALLGAERLARGRGYRAAMGPVEEAVMAEVRRRRADPGAAPLGVVSMLVEARDEDGEPLGERDLRDEMLTLLTDGPTSTSLAWVCERLLRNPDKLARAREDASGGEGRYLDAVVKETLRMRPPVPVVVRTLLEPMELAGHALPAGTVVAPCVPLIHRREQDYPEPHRFLPERFLDRPAPTYAWIPFGGGVRRCLAASYAEMEMKEVLAAILAGVELRPADERSERMRKSAIAFSPDRRALVIAEPRAAGAAGPPTPALA